MFANAAPAVAATPNSAKPTPHTIMEDVGFIVDGANDEPSANSLPPVISLVSDSISAHFATLNGECNQHNLTDPNELSEQDNSVVTTIDYCFNVVNGNVVPGHRVSKISHPNGIHNFTTQ